MLKKISLIFLSLFLVHGFAQELSGDATLGYISMSKDKQMGKEYFQQIQSHLNLLNDPIVNQYIKSLGKRLATAAADPQQGFHFFVVNTDEVNAFTGPGGYIGVNTGLINLVSNESELASVIAHEIGHVKQRHVARAIEHDNDLRIPEIVMTAAAVALGMQNPDAGTGALAATMAGTTQNILKFSRENEQEADRAGLDILYRAGFDPESMPKMLLVLQKIDELYPNDIPIYLETHPSDASRIANSENLAAEYPKKNYSEDSRFAFIAARVRADTTEDPIALEQYYQNKIANEPENQAYNYGYILSLMRLNQYNLAEQQIEKLMNQAPNNIILLLTKAHIQEQLNQNQAAEITLNCAYSLDPSYYPSALASANWMVENHDPKAIEFIQQQLKNHSHDQELYYLLAHAQADNGANVASHQTLAKYMSLLGENKIAKEQLEIALHTSGITTAEKKAIKAKLQP